MVYWNCAKRSKSKKKIKRRKLQLSDFLNANLFTVSECATLIPNLVVLVYCFNFILFLNEIHVNKHLRP